MSKDITELQFEYNGENVGSLYSHQVPRTGDLVSTVHGAGMDQLDSDLPRLIKVINVEWRFWESDDTTNTAHILCEEYL